MAVTRREYTGGATDTTLNGAINNSTLTIAIDDGTGWPTGGTGPFVIDISTGLAAYEKVLCDSRSGNTITANASGRGYDGTSNSAHLDGATVRLVISAVEMDELNAHAANTAHPHTAAGLDTDSVTTAKILDANVTLAKMAANSVDSDQYVDGSIDSAHFAAGAVDATALGNDAVGTAHFSNAIPFLVVEGVTPQTITNNTLTDVNFSGTPIFNRGTFVDTTTTNDGWKVPEDGIYEIRVFGRWATNATGYREITIARTNPQAISGFGTFRHAAATGNTTTSWGFHILDMSSGDEVYSQVRHTSGANLDIENTALMIRWVAPLS